MVGVRGSLITFAPLVLVSFAVAFGAVLWFVPRVRAFALRIRAVQQGGRSHGAGERQHAGAVPNIGGIAILGGFLLAMLVGSLVAPDLIDEYRVQLLAVALGGALMTLVGFIDDMWEVPAALRLATQVVAAGILVVNGVRIGFVTDYFGGATFVFIPEALSVIITILWVVGFTNAFNFIDGLDVALSGFLKTKSGKILIFSFLHNNYVIPTSEIKKGMEKILIYSGERRSQARARDRENLRAYKALSEQESRKSPSAPLTRRQLRQQQLEADRRAAGLSTSRIPIVAPASGQQAPEGQDAQAGKPHQGPSPRTTEEPLNDLSVEQALAARSALVEQAKNQMAMLDSSAQQDPESVDLEVLAEQRKLAERATVLNQRAMARQRLSGQNSQGQPQQNDPTSADNLAMVTPLEFVKVPGVEHPVMKPPTTSHIPVITSTNTRVRPAAGEPAPQVPVRPAPSRPDPSRPAPSRPAPSRPSAPAQGAEGSDDDATVSSPGEGRRSTAGSRSHVLARAEAAAGTRIPTGGAAIPAAGTSISAAGPAVRQLPRPAAGPAPAEEGGPISAHTAHGLEPLDSMTAGVGRARRQRLLQSVTFAIGVMALLVSLMVIFGG